MRVNQDQVAGKNATNFRESGGRFFPVIFRAERLTIPAVIINGSFTPSTRHPTLAAAKKKAAEVMFSGRRLNLFGMKAPGPIPSAPRV